MCQGSAQLAGLSGMGPESRHLVPPAVQVASLLKPAAARPQQGVLQKHAESACMSRLHSEGLMPAPAGTATRGPRTGATTTMRA